MLVKCYNFFKFFVLFNCFFNRIFIYYNFKYCIICYIISNGVFCIVEKIEVMKSWFFVCLIF